MGNMLNTSSRKGLVSLDLWACLRRLQVVTAVEPRDTMPLDSWSFTPQHTGSNFYHATQPFSRHGGPVYCSSQISENHHMWLGGESTRFGPRASLVTLNRSGGWSVPASNPFLRHFEFQGERWDTKIRFSATWLFGSWHLFRILFVYLFR